MLQKLRDNEGLQLKNYLYNIMGKEIKITQIKSSIGYRKRTKNTLIALGIKKMNSTVIKPDNLSIRGMISAVNHLVKVEKVNNESK